MFWYEKYAWFWIRIFTCVYSTVCRVIFCLVLLSPFFICKWFHSIFHLPRHSCVKEIIWEIVIYPVLNFLADNEGKRGENKTWANISLYNSIKNWSLNNSFTLLKKRVSISQMLPLLWYVLYDIVSSLLVLDKHLSFYIKQCDGWKAKISRFEIDDYILNRQG